MLPSVGIFVSLIPGLPLSPFTSAFWWSTYSKCFLTKGRLGNILFFFNLHFCNVIILCYISLTVGWIYNFGYKRSFIMRALLKCLLARKSDAIVIEPLYGQLSLSLELIPSLPLGVLRFHNPEPWHGFIQSFYCTYSESIKPGNMSIGSGKFLKWFLWKCLHALPLSGTPTIWLLGLQTNLLTFYPFLLFSISLPFCFTFLKIVFLTLAS